MSRESRLTAGILLILMPTVVYGGASILSMLVGDLDYAQNALRQDLRRAGHAHAGVLLVLSLVTLRYVDEARLSKGIKRLARRSIPGQGARRRGVSLRRQSPRPQAPDPARLSGSVDPSPAGQHDDAR